MQSSHSKTLSNKQLLF